MPRTNWERNRCATDWKTAYPRASAGPFATTLTLRFPPAHHRSRPGAACATWLDSPLSDSVDVRRALTGRERGSRRHGPMTAATPMLGALAGSRRLKPPPPPQPRDTARRASGKDACLLSLGSSYLPARRLVLPVGSGGGNQRGALGWDRMRMELFRGRSRLRDGLSSREISCIFVAMLFWGEEGGAKLLR